MAEQKRIVIIGGGFAEIDEDEIGAAVLKRGDARTAVVDDARRPAISHSGNSAL